MVGAGVRALNGVAYGREVRGVDHGLGQRAAHRVAYVAFISVGDMQPRTAARLGRVWSKKPKRAPSSPLRIGGFC